MVRIHSNALHRESQARTKGRQFLIGRDSSDQLTAGTWVRGHVRGDLQELTRAGADDHLIGREAVRRGELAAQRIDFAVGVTRRARNAGQDRFAGLRRGAVRIFVAVAADQSARGRRRVRVGDVPTLLGFRAGEWHARKQGGGAEQGATAGQAGLFKHAGFGGVVAHGGLQQ